MTVIDRLSNSNEPAEAEGGLKASYLLELPTEQRRVMRLLLRQAELTYPELCQQVAALPAEEQLSREVLDQALAALTEQNWLLRIEEGQTIRYKTNFQRKTEGALEKVPTRRRAGPLARGIWDALEAKDSKG